MTDGGIYYSGRGEELKEFNTQDGHGLVKVQRSGIRVGIITGRVSRIVRRRAKELGITEVHQNQVNKLEAYRRIKKKLGVEDAEVAYIGDDEPDVPLLKRVGFSATPSDANKNAVRVVDYVCRRGGGKGAVREVIDLLLDARA